MIRAAAGIYADAFRGLPGDVWRLSIGLLLTRAGTMVLPFLSLYAVRELGYDTGAAATVFFAFGLGSDRVPSPTEGQAMIRVPQEPRGGAAGDPAPAPAGAPDPAAEPGAETPARKIADDLRLLRTRQKLSQAAASRLEGAPNVRTVCHWETARKIPNLKFLIPTWAAWGST